MYFAPAFHTLGSVLLAFAATMVLPALVAFGYGEMDQGWTFLGSLGLTVFAGGALIIATQGERPLPRRREIFLMALLIWLLVPAFGALPFYFIGVVPGITDAYFEAVSGFTTTGATVLSQLDIIERSVLLWRALLQWLGGLSAVLLAMVVLTPYDAGGMQLFRSAVPHGERLSGPNHLRQALATMSWVYVGLTALCAALLWAVEMPAFDAVCHALSTLSTGGFSTRDGSLAAFANPLAEAVIAVFMLVGAINFTLHWAVLSGRGSGALRQDPELPPLLILAAVAALAIVAALMLGGSHGPLPALRHGLFATLSMLTTTGYYSQAPVNWPLFVPLLLILLVLLGGCSGSSAGGLKIFRGFLLLKLGQRELARLSHPHGVVPVAYGGHVIDDGAKLAIWSFFFTYLFGLALLSLLLAGLGLEMADATTAAAAALANAGPALALLPGAALYESMPDAVKWVLLAGMLLGRLEFFVIFVLASPRHWRD